LAPALFSRYFERTLDIAVAPPYNATMRKEILHNKAFHKIKEARKILLVTHEKPDVDAVSSVCAFIDLLVYLFYYGIL